MNLTGDTSSLGQHRAEVCLHPVHPQPVKQPRKQSQSKQEDCVKPIGLVEVGFQVESEGSAGLVPNTIVVTGDDAEGVSAGPQIGVISDPPVAAIDPVLVKAFQLVLEPDSLRRYEARGRVVQVKTRCA